MAYSLYNPSIDIVRPKFWIARPNKQIVTRIKELDELANLKVELGGINGASGINEVSGDIPYNLTRNGKTIQNPHVKYLKNKYLLKMKFMNNIEWFVIEDVAKNADEEKDTVSFTAYSLAYTLRGKKLYNDKFDGKTPKEVFDDLLSGTTWAVGKISTQLGGKIRSFDEFSPNTNLLEAIGTVCESYGGIPTFDTDNELINLLHKDDYAIMSNLMLNDKNYIKSYKKDSDTNEIVTRLFPLGENELSISSITPTGQMYIEKYDWYMYPFQRDIDKNVLVHSDYMSDELCNAILDQQEAITNIKDLVKQKQDLINTYYDELITLQNAVDDSKLKYEICEGILDVMRSNEEYYYSEFLTNSSTYSFSFRQGYFIGQARAKNGATTAQLSFGGTTRNLTNDWSTFRYDMSALDPLGDGQSMTVTSLTSDNCEFYIVRVPDGEYNSYTDQQVKEKYNGIYLKELYNTALGNYNNKQNQINTTQSELTALYDSVGDDKFYTLELLREKDRFIHVYYWEETTHTVVQELYDDAVEKLNELHSPKLSLETDIVDFLASLDDKRNWKKLILGSRILTKYSRLDEYNEVILTGIEYDFSGETIKLTLDNVKDIKRDITWKMIMQGANASSTLNLNKKLWDDTVVQSKTFEQLFNSDLDTTKRRILAGVNESVQISNRGIQVTSVDYPDNMLILNAGVLAISNNKGQTFDNAITTAGIIGQKVIGKLLIGQKLLIRDDDGTMILNGSLQTIKDRSDNVKVQLGEYNPNQFGLQVYDGAVNIRTKGTTGNTGLILDINGLRSYDNSGREMFNLNSNTGSATFSGDLNGANGTFTGNLSAVGGTFTGTLQGVDGTFTGTLNGNVINGATINGSTINTTGTSNGYNITTKINSSGYEYIHSSYGGIKLQYGVLNGTNSAFMVVPTQSSSLGAFVLRGTQFQVEDANGVLTMFANDSMVAIKPNLYVTSNIYQNGDPVATIKYVDTKGFLTQSTADNRYAYKSHTHTSIDTGYLTLSGGTLQANSGSLWIGQNTVKANTIEQLSNRDYKKNIVDWEYNALDMINSTPIRQFQYKTELDSEFPHVGIIVQESPVWVVDINGEGVEPNKIAVLGWKGLQEIDKKTEGLRQRIETLELLTSQQNDVITNLVSRIEILENN